MDKETKEALKTIRNFNLEPTKEMKLPTNRKEMILSLKDELAAVAEIYEEYIQPEPEPQEKPAKKSMMDDLIGGMLAKAMGAPPEIGAAMVASPSPPETPPNPSKRYSKDVEDQIAHFMKAGYTREQVIDLGKAMGIKGL
jgi:hypothetical protein